MHIQLLYFINCMRRHHNEPRIDFKRQNYYELCKQLAVQEVLKPQTFFHFVDYLLAQLLKCRQLTKPKKRIDIYRTIKSNIQRYPLKYGQEKKVVIIRYGHLIICEICKLLQNSKTFLDFEQEDEQLLMQDSNYMLIRDYVNLLKVLQVNFNSFLSYFIMNFRLDDWYENWAMQSAYFIGIAEFTSIKGIESKKKVMQTIYDGLMNTNPYVKYYALYSLIKELDPQTFTQKLYHQFITVIKQSLYYHEDLVYKSLECFKLFIHKFGKRAYLQKDLSFFLTTISQFYKKFKSNKIINCYLDCLVILSDISMMFDSKELNICIKCCNSIVVNLKIKNNQILLDKGVESLCKIINNFKYNNHVEDYYNLVLTYLQDSSVSEDILLTCWKFLCFTGIKFKIWKYLFPKVIQTTNKYSRYSQIKKRNLAYLVIKQTSVCFKEKFADYFLQALKIIVPYLKMAVQQGELDEVEEICSSLDAIISSQRQKQNLQENYQQEHKKMTKKQIKNKKQFHTILLKQIIKIMKLFFYLILTQPQTIQNLIKESLLFSLKVIIENYGDILPKKYKIFVLNSFWLTVRNFNKEKQIEENFESEQKNDAEFSDKKYSLNRCRIALPLILAAIIKHIPTQSQKMLQKAMEEINKHCGDHYDLICKTRYIASIQSLPMNQIQEHQPKFISFLMENSTSHHPSLRTEISYTVGLMVLNTLNHFSQKLKDWLNILLNCYYVPKNYFDHDEEYGVCRENCICVIGHLIYHFRKQIELNYDLWLDNLPLKYEKEQNKTQFDLLINIVNNQPHAFIQQKILGIDDFCQQQEEYSSQSILRVYKMLRILSEVKAHLNREPNIKQNRDILRRAKEAVGNILDWPIYIQYNQQILKGLLTEEEKAHLSELLRIKI